MLAHMLKTLEAIANIGANEDRQGFEVGNDHLLHSLRKKWAIVACNPLIK